MSSDTPTRPAPTLGRRLLDRSRRPHTENDPDEIDPETARRKKAWKWWRNESLWERPF
jgi:hypothetical protein